MSVVRILPVSLSSVTLPPTLLLCIFICLLSLSSLLTLVRVIMLVLPDFPRFMFESSSSSAIAFIRVMKLLGKLLTTYCMVTTSSFLTRGGPSSSIFCRSLNTRL